MARVLEEGFFSMEDVKKGTVADKQGHELQQSIHQYHTTESTRERGESF